MIVYRLILFAVACLGAVQADARDLFKTMADPPTKVWKTTNASDLKFCIITSLAHRTGQASTVVEKGEDTLVIVHNWSSPVPGDDVRAIFTIKADGQIEFRGQKVDLIEELERCASL